MTQIIPYRNRVRKTNGIFEYLILRKPTTSSILATLLMSSFLTATILPWIITTKPVAANKNNLSIIEKHQQ